MTLLETASLENSILDAQRRAGVVHQFVTVHNVKDVVVL